MNLRITAAAVAIAIGLSGCATTGGADLVETIRNYARQACGFLPTVEFVVDILQPGDGIQNAFSLAEQICDLMRPQPGARGAPLGAPTIRGVPIEGHFL